MSMTSGLKSTNPRQKMAISCHRCARHPPLVGGAVLRQVVWASSQKLACLTLTCKILSEAASACSSVTMPCLSNRSSIFRKQPAVTKESPSAVCRPCTGIRNGARPLQDHASKYNHAEGTTTATCRAPAYRSRLRIPPRAISETSDRKRRCGRPARHRRQRRETATPPPAAVCP